MARILTITLNPALDLNAELDRLAPGQVNRTDATSLEPAGKGINVARVLARLGHEVTVSGLLGTDNAAPFERLFADEGLTDRFVRVGGRNRVNIKLAERGGRITDINSAGFASPGDALTRLQRELESLMPGHDVIVIGGSLPGQLVPAAVADLVSQARRGGTPVWLDTSGDALAEGLKAKPHGIKPNLDELAEWAGQTLAGRQQVADVATALRSQGIAQVVVSLGAEGVLWLSAEGDYQSTPPPVSVGSTVCAGDTLLAALVHGQLQSDQPAAEQLRFATALSAECVRHAGVGDPAACDFHSLLDQTRVHPWPGENNNGETLS